jgi:hypothetical protein
MRNINDVVLHRLQLDSTGNSHAGAGFRGVPPISFKFNRPIHHKHAPSQITSESLPMQDVTPAALYVSSKMHDTLKKPRELLMASYTVRFPEQAAKSKSIVGEIDMDPAVRQHAPFQAMLWTVKIGSRAR